MNVLDVGILFEQVLSGFELRLLVESVPDDERVEASNDPRVLEFSGDPAGGIPRAEQDKGLAGRFDRDVEVES